MSGRAAALSIVQSPRSFGATLLVATQQLLPFDSFDSDDSFLTWDAQTIHDELELLHEGGLSEANFNKLMAAIQVVKEDSFYKNLDDFVRICNALYDGTVGVDFDPAYVAEMAWGLTESQILWPEPDLEFDDEIVAYMQKTLEWEGFVTAPKSFPVPYNGQQNPYADDPLLFQAVYQAQQEKSDNINQEVATRLNELTNQLNILGLDGVRTLQAAIDQ